jgi:regulator of protease activity HflC (stomatin/prohibitin superfamily)
MNSDQAEEKSKALARNLREAFVLGRIAQAFAAVDLVLQLTGLFDSRLILQILLVVLFLYETVMYVLSLAIRLIRRELSSQPLMPLSPKHMGASGILSYLEENTGITMRSLWSIRFIRQLLPSVALFAVLLVWLATGLVQIESHQQGALYRCGKLQDKTLKPGIHLTLPWPFDRVEIRDTQSLRKVVVGYVPNDESTSDNVWTEGHGQEEYRLLLGGGNEMVSINLVVEYRISDLNQYLRRSANAESLLQAAAYEIVTERTIATDIDALLSADRTVFSETFQQELARRMEDQELGLEVAEVVLESIHPPVEVASTYQRVISAGIEAQ